MSLFDSKFFDFNIHPDPVHSIAQLAHEAKRYGYSGIAIINSGATEDTDLPENFSIYSGVEITGRPARIREEIRKHKSGIITVPGGHEELNHVALETEGLDILLQPQEFNNVLAKEASDNSIAIGFNLGSIIHLRGEARIRELMFMRTNLRHARKYHLSMILVSNAHSIYDLRSPREMAALAGLFGMTQKEAVEAMSAIPLGILKRKSPEYIQEGIEIV